jgi:hypothetical protein
VLAGRKHRAGPLAEMGVEVFDFQIRHARNDAGNNPVRT